MQLMIDANKFTKEIASRLVTVREKQGISQTQLADMVGLCQQTIADYETGRRGISISKLAVIADALGVSAASLLDTQAGYIKKTRGPESKIDQLANQVKTLPRSRQLFVIEMLENAVSRAN